MIIPAWAWRGSQNGPQARHILSSARSIVDLRFIRMNKDLDDSAWRLNAASLRFANARRLRSSGSIRMEARDDAALNECLHGHILAQDLA